MLVRRHGVRSSRWSGTRGKGVSYRHGIRGSSQVAFKAVGTDGMI